jgi:hypothetical protein
MKKKYITPQIQTVFFHAPVVMISTSGNNVNNYGNGGSVMAGDDDDLGS